MPSTTYYDDARELAAEAHAGQQRNFTGDPFVVHPQRVAAKVRAAYRYFDFDISLSLDELLAAAVLHDVLEDTDASIDQFPSSVQTAVRDVTHPDEQFYRDYIVDIANRGIVPSLIKLCDMWDNMTDGLKPHTSRMDKYQLAERYLLEKNGIDPNEWEKFKLGVAARPDTYFVYAGDGGDRKCVAVYGNREDAEDFAEWYPKKPVAIEEKTAGEPLE